MLDTKAHFYAAVGKQVNPVSLSARRLRVRIPPVALFLLSAFLLRVALHVSWSVKSFGDLDYKGSINHGKLQPSNLRFYGVVCQLDVQTVF